ncbi:MAG: hypothetical protein E5Y65_26035 [Mesorhizobium sp.]|uniref:hypothetical protein n=1 Tax=Mesorhizobium sp. TaxID=1871066 RepID=UPI001221FD54|nr:hypothetical protein [Mesorhizobium sp.]TIL72280.1 MAG: hypothetical protein E5Y70_22465 [Mesorhizobium sp.]TIL86610.1 MAG: hypothetical protein E5Y65_26035 [Mesorhizobium sp.]TIL98389.1 MAG: hypothetical protein E5Y64_26485 [Mesorhizobium sp.]
MTDDRIPTRHRIGPDASQGLIEEGRTLSGVERYQSPYPIGRKNAAQDAYLNILLTLSEPKP